jgi:hypothetical protein
MANDTPSDTVLDDTPARALKLLGALSTNRAIRAILAKRGYTQADHERGWQLTLKASGYRRPPPVVLDTPASRDAIAAIDAWDEPNFRVARAALSAEFPKQNAFVFQDLAAQTGVAAVASVTTFLDRLDALEAGKDREATREADLAALAKLATRGIDAAERARLRKLLEIALGPSADTPADAVPEIDPAAEENEQREAKLALWRWYTEWREIARADVKRKDHLIQLGMAERKPPTKRLKMPTSPG